VKKFLFVLFLVGCGSEPERQLTQTEYAAYNYCKQVNGESCRKDSVECRASIHQLDSTFCGVKHYVSMSGFSTSGNPVSGGADMLFRCECKNLVCQ
jgi:hypothetical protein